MKKWGCIFLVVFICGCNSNNSSTKKFIRNFDNVIDVREQIKEIKVKDVMISAVARPYLLNDYLLIGDSKSTDYVLHIFNKNNFEYVSSAIKRGRGPREISNMGTIGVDEMNNRFFLSDYGKQRIFSYDLDSLLVNPIHMPDIKMETSGEQFPIRYNYLNDTLSIGIVLDPIGENDFQHIMAKWNMSTGQITPMEYVHPDMEKKRINYAVSLENNLYAESYTFHDLLTICSIDGELKYNIYGKDWDKRGTNKIYYGEVHFCMNNIIALFSGDNIENENGDANYPTKFLVFDLNGDYLQTLETGYKITHFRYDKDFDRIIMTLDDEMQFAYLDLDGLID